MSRLIGAGSASLRMGRQLQEPMLPPTVVHILHWPCSGCAAKAAAASKQEATHSEPHRVMG